MNFPTTWYFYLNPRWTDTRRSWPFYFFSHVQILIAVRSLKMLCRMIHRSINIIAPTTMPPIIARLLMVICVLIILLHQNYICNLLNIFNVPYWETFGFFDNRMFLVALRNSHDFFSPYTGRPMHGIVTEDEQLLFRECRADHRSGILNAAQKESARGEQLRIRVNRALWKSVSAPSRLSRIVKVIFAASPGERDESKIEFGACVTSSRLRPGAFLERSWWILICQGHPPHTCVPRTPGAGVLHFVRNKFACSLSRQIIIFFFAEYSRRIRLT